MALALVGLGVVYGDIGTSPLYTLGAVFPNGAPNDENMILGVFSMIFWTLTSIGATWSVETSPPPLRCDRGSPLLPQPTADNSHAKIVLSLPQCLSSISCSQCKLTTMAKVNDTAFAELKCCCLLCVFCVPAPPIPTPLPPPSPLSAGGIFALYALICRSVGVRDGTHAHEADLSLMQYSLQGSSARRHASTVASKVRGGPPLCLRETPPLACPLGCGNQSQTPPHCACACCRFLAPLAGALQRSRALQTALLVLVLLAANMVIR